MLAFVLVVGVAGLWVSSCCWLWGGAGAAAGYKVSTDERSVGDQVNDANITATIKTKLIAEKGIRSMNIDVDCVNGHVTLTGIVKNRDQMRTVKEIARSVKGVKSVTNNLKVKSN